VSKKCDIAPIMEVLGGRKQLQRRAISRATTSEQAPMPLSPNATRRKVIMNVTRIGAMRN
jgi:hypothetical protein